MDIGNVQPIDINDEMRDSYLDYAMSVIVSRALPDARDGLKPVHRRILFAMHDMGINASSPYKKSARIVGEVLGKYHPHGDSAVYDSMVRLAQDFSMRYPLVDGQGNFGSVDGDGAAAMRYTEARMAKIAELMLDDIDRNTVDFTDNFDGTLQEPDVLPSALPNLLLNGTSGIAVGMATNIPPHNLREVASAVDFMIGEMTRPDKETIDEELADITVNDLMAHIKGPDFPTGGTIVGSEGIISAYATGRGRITLRAKSRIEQMNNGRFRIVVNEIPYQVNKSLVIEKIAHLVHNGRLDQISDLRDESDRQGMAIVIELKRNAQPRTVLNRLLKFTQLQTTFGTQMLALVNGEPRLLSLKNALKHFINHRREVIERRTLFDLEKARRRAHVLEGLLIAIANLDAIIATIRSSPDADAARSNLIERYNLTDIQAQAILDMQLRRLAALERQKIEEEYQSLLETIEQLEDLLSHPRKILALIRDELNAVAEKYGDPRNTDIIPAEEEFNEADLIKDEDVFIMITKGGYMKRVSADEYRTQGRGGKGVIGITTKETDDVDLIYSAGSHDHVLFFSNRGKVYQEKAYQIPESSRTARGVPLSSVLLVKEDEKITAAVPVPDYQGIEYCILITRQGRIKRVAISEFESVRPSGLIALSLDDNDELGWVLMSAGDQDLIVVTAEGMSIRFNENDVRPMGRTAAGVNAIKLKKGDSLAGVALVESDEGEILIVTENGYGKRTELRDYPLQSRYGIGVRTLANRERTGRIVDAMTVAETDEVTLITQNGKTLRTRISDISQIGRLTQGVQLMDLAEGDILVSVALLDERRRLAREKALAQDNQTFENNDTEEVNDNEE